MEKKARIAAEQKLAKERAEKEKERAMRMKLEEELARLKKEAAQANSTHRGSVARTFS